MRIKAWHVVIAGVIAGVLFAIVCIVGGVITAPSNNSTPAKPGKSTAAKPPPEPAPVLSPTPKPVPVPTSVKGNNNSVVPTGTSLDGAFTVTYSFGSWCGQVNFLKTDGSSGSKFLEDINDCASSSSDKLNGSTIVHLTGVTMVKVGNTRGQWSLTFTPIG